MSRDLNASLAAIDAAFVDLPFEAKASAMGPRLAYAGLVLGDMEKEAAGSVPTRWRSGGVDRCAGAR